ncbi:putative glycoside hydrolase family 15 protein [Actinosynnema sp. NPDC047251]|uniref:Putative secreted protein n=1 Tax=Saccharothrix espanaensis (strain ATCC 51144 / DSM 44229 / JCM 9112 / NBRC 15066 / NRRL 15764) TaxID=1179773 RepID=K0JZ26_SACES|nr:putative glycoside hydrolase family 15 protein [Saccharothrix espanaensis]CCH31381.1 putative secreted protein [Saccharothrix espanaensis DSM 44229]
MTSFQSESMGGRRGRGRLTGLLGVVAVTAALVVVPGTTANAVGTPTVDGRADSYGGVGDAQSFWLHLNSTPVSDSMAATEAKRHKYVVLNAWEGGLLKKLKASNPKVQVYVYKDLSSTRSYACKGGVDDKYLPAGVGYCAADQNHPEWFLLGPTGKRLEYSGYSGHWQMDVGNTTYQNAWAANVIADARVTGFDGVFMDNALFPCDAYHEGVCPPKYPTDAKFQSAYKSMLANLKARFAGANLKTVANLSNARLHNGAWDAYTEHLDGGFDEWWLTFDNRNLLPEYDQGWSRQVAEIASNEARGKITLVQPHFSPGQDRPQRYAMASYLLALGDKAAISEIENTDDYGDPTARSAMYDWNLGRASGAYRSVSPNVFRRDFACGTVIVNANKDKTEPVRLKLGTSYTDERGAKVSSVTLAGTSGTILRKTCA